jgi:hypothetical protein
MISNVNTNYLYHSVHSYCVLLYISNINSLTIDIDRFCFITPSQGLMVYIITRELKNRYKYDFILCSLSYTEKQLAFQTHFHSV